MPADRVTVESVRAAAAHFSVAVTAPSESQLLFVSGLSARADDGSVVGEGDVVAQTEEIYRKLDAVLTAAGGGLEDVVRMDVFVRNARDQPAVAAARRAHHADTVPPTSTMVVVSGFPDERYLLEISAIAAVPRPRRRGRPMLLRLASDDDVAVATRDLAQGEELVLDDGTKLVSRSPIPFGHKVALRPVRRGENIAKYGQPIGHATSDIAIGDHVHTHNLAGNRLAVGEVP